MVGTVGAQEPKLTKRVLILITDEKFVPGYALAEEGMRKVFDQSPDFQFEYFIEHMDHYRFKATAYQEKLLDLYRTKYIGKKIDLVLAYGYQALDFAVAHSNEIFPQSSLVFSAVFKNQLKRLNAGEKIAGTLLKIDYRQLLLLALKNHPNTRHVVVISVTSKMGRFMEHQTRKKYAPYKLLYDFIYPGHMAMGDMLNMLKTLPRNTVVIYYFLALDGNGVEFEPWKVASMISEAANAQVYGYADTYLRHGIVGGALLSYKAQGRKSAEIGLRILNGENFAHIPSSAAGTTLNTFDWRQLKRWGINERDLPEESIVRYKERSIWELYRWQIVGGISLIIIQSILLYYLFLQRSKDKKNERRLRKSESRYKAFVVNSNEAIWCIEFKKPLFVDRPEGEQLDHVFTHGFVAEANDAYARSVGFEKGEQLTGTMMRDFLPQSAPENIATIREWIRGKYNIINAETVESYKEGVHRVFLNNSVSIIEAGRVVRVWGTAIDITERKEVEAALSQSRDFNTAILNAIEDHIVVLDRDGMILTVNESWIRFARENNADLSRIGEGINYLDMCRRATDGRKRPNGDQEYAAKALTGLTHALNGSIPTFMLEYPCHSPDTERWFQMVTMPFKGTLGGLLISHRDITEQKQMEREILDLERKYRTVADFTHDWEYWEAPDGRLLYVSPSCERITGYSPSDFIAHPDLIWTIILPEDLSAWKAHHEESKTCADNTHLRFRIRNRDGATRWIDHVHHRVCDEQGNDAGIRVSNRDITKLKRVENEAREARDVLVHLDRTETLGQLAGAIAHELNQPLTGILSNAQAGEMLFMQKKGNEALMEAILTDIIADSKRAGDILRNLRNLFVREETELKALDLNGVIRETLGLLNSEFIIQGLTVQADLSHGLPNVLGNGVQIQQVIINLIKNAREAMGGLTKRDGSISITTCSGDENEVQVHVTDTGPGIDPGRIEKIFHPYITSGHDGLGIGLSICRSIVESHGGRIWAENGSTGGCRMSFTLPAVEKES